MLSSMKYRLLDFMTRSKTFNHRDFNLESELIFFNKLVYYCRTLFAISFSAGSLGQVAAYFGEYAKATFAAGLIFKVAMNEYRHLPCRNGVTFIDARRRAID